VATDNREGAYSLSHRQPVPETAPGAETFLAQSKAWGVPSTRGAIVMDDVVLKLADAASLGEAVVALESVESLRPKQGNATKALAKIAKLADENGVTLALKAVPFPSRTGGLIPKDVLTQFYERHGFRTQFTKDHGFAYMFRAPKYGR
jgi:hypothetical protein